MNAQDLEYINDMLHDDAEAMEPEDMDRLLDICEWLDAEAED